MKAKKTLKRFTGMIAAFAFAISLCAPAVGIVASAAEVIKVENFATQSVTEDLADMDLSVYPVNDKGMPQVIRCQEFCYSEDNVVAKHYGLYLYIYNPSARPLMNQCTVNMAVAYNQSGNPSAYENVQLDICNFSEDKLFYKFKVKDAARFYDVAKGYANDNLDARRYDISGITLVYSDSTKKTDNDVSKTYLFEGYASGCGEDKTEESTLTCTVNGLETLHLNVNHTNYIADTPKDVNNNIYDQLHTIYFSIPEKYFEQYGELQKIKADWYEYKTSPIFVTWDLDAYEALLPYVGEFIGNKDESLDWRILWDSRVMGLSHSLTTTWYYESAYNKNRGDTRITELHINSINTYDFSDAEAVPRMSFLFYRDEDNFEVSSRKLYVSSNDLLKEMKRGRFSTQQKVNGYPFEYFSDTGYISKETWGDADMLSINKIDEKRIPYLENPSLGYGHVIREIDVGDDSFIEIQNPNQGFWDVIWNGVDYVASAYKPIEVLTGTEIDKVKSTSFGEKYLVNEAEEGSVYNFCKQETQAGNRAVLFRFAKTDYQYKYALFDKVGNGMSTTDGYVARQTVFLDFDIISLTFRVEGRLDKVLPVVSDPVDIISSIDASDDVFEQGNDPFAGLGDLFDGLGSTNDKIDTVLQVLGWTLGGCAIIGAGIGIFFLVKKSKGKDE